MIWPDFRVLLTILVSMELPFCLKNSYWVVRICICVFRDIVFLLWLQKTRLMVRYVKWVLISRLYYHKNFWNLKKMSFFVVETMKRVEYRPGGLTKNIDINLVLSQGIVSLLRRRVCICLLCDLCSMVFFKCSFNFFFCINNFSVSLYTFFLKPY